MNVNIKVTSSKYDRNTFALITETQVGDSKPTISRFLIDRTALMHTALLSGSSAQRLEQLRVNHLETQTKTVQETIERLKATT